MDIYVIPPVSALHLMNEGHRYFCLAQLYMKHESYREFFLKKKVEGAWITLDNGAGDHDLVSIEEVLAIAEELRPNEVIPPDVLFNAEVTLSNLHSFYEQMLERNIKDVEIFACPQGKDLNEWLECYNIMRNTEFVKTLGMSKITVPKIMLPESGPDEQIKDGRILMYRLLKSAGMVTKPLHMLGMGDPTEMEEYKHDPMVRSTDSCNTVWSAMNHIFFFQYNFRRIPTPKDYFDRHLTTDHEVNALKNILWMKQLVSV